MSDKPQTPSSGKRRGPVPTGKGTPVLVRLQPDLLEWLDTERERQAVPTSRPEMIRAILESAKGGSGST